MKWEEWKAGSVIKGRYYIKQKLSSGNVTTTYLATDHNATKEVVIKTLNTELLNKLTQDEINGLQDKVWKEAIELQKCKHEHIVTIIDAFKDKDTNLVCIVMEYIKGESFANLKKFWSEKEALKYIQQVGEALICVHQHGLVHRNVKPSNILLQEGQLRKAVLIDFGLVRGFDNNLTVINPDTADGFIPEELCYARDDRGPFTDIYSLAATLYFLLTKEVPPSVKSRTLRVGKQKAYLEEPKKYNSSVSDRVNQAIIQAMELEAQKRPQSIEEWFKLLGLRRSLPPFWQKESWKIWWNIIVIIGIPVGLISGIITIIQYFQNQPILPPPPTPTPNILNNKSLSQLINRKSATAIEKIVQP